ncbi:high-potential iron-sulfur protein [Nitrosomonas halophila]|uniref:High-potential iron-sulfur protein n=1 Tax=Nitrosomonas halophila TaxID=44576 RepID=A0A1H3LG42_9PROT|nr:high-potential iron-sulfur protein [Nitrosomonas halophila]SDY62928.1 High potential iron-sulfur protein [Nitrosomonas halophila]HRQ04623.1 high-potential iron-sulfur protein [Nitrosomonas halophila]
MNYRHKKFSRRELIKFMAFGATTPFIWGLTNKTEAAKASKAQVKYQDEPKGNEKCSNCIHFIPGETQDANGECKVVQGSVSPQGWCTAFAPES